MSSYWITVGLGVPDLYGRHQPVMATKTHKLVQGWYLTWSQVGVDCEIGGGWTKELVLQRLKAIDNVLEYCICHELHEDGGDHYHAYVKFQHGVPWRDVLTFKFFGKTANAEAARSARAVIKYVEKNPDYITNIQNIETYIGNKVRKRNRDILEMGANRAVDDGLVRIEDYCRVRQSIDSYNLHKVVVLATEECKGIWLYGLTGAGKSQMALEKWPLAFQKSGNKWWDGYRGQETVIMDDLGKEAGQRLAYHIKRWTDKWPAPGGEVKHGTVPLPFKTFVVTSQWSIDEMFDVPQDRDAIKRRCLSIHVNNYIGVVDEGQIACDEVYDGNYDVE